MAKPKPYPLSPNSPPAAGTPLRARRLSQKPKTPTSVQSMTARVKPQTPGGVKSAMSGRGAEPKSPSKAAGKASGGVGEGHIALAEGA